jgi:carboxypeptidase T
MALTVPFVAGSNQEQHQSDEVLSSWLVTPDGTIPMQSIADRFDVEHKSGETFEIIVPVSRQQEFLRLAPEARLKFADIRDEFRQLEKGSPEHFADYHTFDAVMRKLNDLATARPDIAQIVQYGTSTSGRPLVALKLSDNVTMDEDEPELMLTAATHGDEIITTEVLLGLIDELVAGYSTDARLTAMLDERELFMIPVINADGFASRSRYSDGRDPNRDYPWPETPNRTSVRPIAAVMEFFHSRNIVGAIDLHAYGQMVMYPWAYTATPPDSTDAGMFQTLGDTMAAVNDYEVGQISRVIYVAKGSSADYYYWKKGTVAYGIELTTSKAPPSARIPDVIDESREMMWAFIEHF